jgi:dihydroorotate dehydrogenase electron transfer subunit
MADKKYYEVKAEVISWKKHNGRTVSCIVKAPEIAGSFVPGQFITVQVAKGYDNSPVLRRPFAVSMREGDDFEFIFDIVGRGTEKLLEFISSDKFINILGPLGNGFDTLAGGREKLLIAGGIGIAPIKSLVQYFSERNISVKLIWGNRSADGFFDLEFYKSRNVEILTATDDGTCGFKGNVLELIKSYKSEGVLNPLGSYDVYAVGPERMMKAAASYSDAEDHICQVSLETPMACGMGVCQGCAVKKRKEEGYYLVCKDGPVFFSDEVII